MRNKQIDILKAIGILLVVAGHAGSPLYHWIYSFHMPLFFFVSGFLRYSSQTKPWKQFLKNKAKSSIVPYVVFWFFSVVIYGNVYSLLRHGHFSPFGIDQLKGLLLGGGWLAEYSNNFPLWYLQLFFIAVILFEIIVRYCSPTGKVLVSAILIFATIPVQNLLPGRPVFHINVLPAALVFLIAGYYTNFLFTTKIPERIQSSLLPGALLLVLGYWISSLHWGNLAEINSILYFPGALCTIVGFYILSNLLGNIPVLHYLGSNTLYILGSHILCMTYAKAAVAIFFRIMGFSNGLLENILVTVLTILLCCGLIEGVRFLLGKIKKY